MRKYTINMFRQNFPKMTKTVAKDLGIRCAKVNVQGMYKSVSQ